MKIPSDATIAPEKLTRYLLVARPKNDKSRFLAQAGFTIHNPEALDTAIRRLFTDYEAIMDRQDEYGDFYIVEGDLIGPDGNLNVITVWLTQPDLSNGFRFVTLKPGTQT